MPPIEMRITDAGAFRGRAPARDPPNSAPVSDANPQPSGNKANEFSERQFYLGEFRGRTLGFALPPGCAAGRMLRETAGALTVAGARAVILRAEVPSAQAAWPPDSVSGTAPRLEGECWRRLAAAPVLAVDVPGRPFADACRELAVRLGLFKLVWLDARGGLGVAGSRRAFVDLDELRSLLAAEGALPADARRSLWVSIREMLEAGLPAVNVCDEAGLDDELFSYAGSGTLFTRERYISVRRLGVDDFDAAADLIQRGIAEGYLAPRRPEQVDAILASGFGAFVEGSHLAGIGALLRVGQGGEITSLYTLTRFLGEGVGAHLVRYAVEVAAGMGLGFAFACTTSERVGAFFERNGFRPVDAAEVPAEKWRDYDPLRRPAVRCFRRDLEP